MTFIQFPSPLAFFNTKISISGKTLVSPLTPASRELMTSGSIDVEKQSPKPLPYSVVNSNNILSADATKEERKPRSRIGRYLLSEVNTSWTDITLIICGFVSGLVDGLSFTYWNSFSDMQTGTPLIQHLYGISRCEKDKAKRRSIFTNISHQGTSSGPPSQ